MFGTMQNPVIRPPGPPTRASLFSRPRWDAIRIGIAAVTTISMVHPRHR